MFDQSSWIPIRWVYLLINCELRVSLLLNELSFMLKEFAYSSIYVYKYIYIFIYLYNYIIYNIYFFFYTHTYTDTPIYILLLLVKSPLSNLLAEGSLEVKLLTIIWTDEKAEVGKVREEKRREGERRSEKRKSQKKAGAGARKGRKVAKHSVFPMFLWLFPDSCSTSTPSRRLGSSHLLIFTSSHLHIFSIFTSSHLHICSSSHLLILTSSHLHILTSSHLLLLPSRPLALLPSPSFLFLFWRQGQGQWPTRRHETQPLCSHEMRFDRQRLR